MHGSHISHGNGPTHVKSAVQRIAVALKNLFIPCRDSVNCNFITESWHGINKFFNATAILCTADFTCVEQLVYSVP